VRRALALALGFTALCMALGGAAGAQVVTLRGFPKQQLVGGPQLAGDRVAWSQETCLTGCRALASNGSDRFEIFSAGRGRRARLFRARTVHGASGPDSSSEWYPFLLSEQVLATTHISLRGAEADIDARGEAELRAGPPGGARELLLSCRSNAFAFVGVAPVALDGSRLAYDPDPCDGTASLVVRDLATGATQTLPEPSGGSLMRLRGRFVAWIEGTGPAAARLVVYDLEAGARAYSAVADRVHALDVDSDGTVAAVNGQMNDLCVAGRLLRYSVADPRPVDLGVDVCATGVRIEGGRIVFLGWEGFTRTLRAMDPGGAVEDLVRFDRVLPGDFDAGGDRVAWAARNCAGGEAIFTATLSDLPQSAGSINCRARFRSGLVRVRRGVANVRLRCPRGCGGEVSLRHMGRADFSLLRSEDEVRIRLRRGARARLERRGSLDVLAKLVTRNRAGDRQARSRGVMLVAAG
jgi:hypothetical protein